MPQFRRCSASRTRATAAPNLTSRSPPAGHIPSSPENTVVAVPPHSECGHPQPASFSSAPHSHTVHPKPTAAPYTRVEKTRHNTAMSNRHRDGHPSRQQWGARRPRNRGSSLRSAGVSPYVAALSQCQIDNRDRTRRAPSLGPTRRHRGADRTTISVGRFPSVDQHQREFSASVPALVMQPPRDDRAGQDVGPGFGGSARSPTHVHAVS